MTTSFSSIVPQSVTISSVFTSYRPSSGRPHEGVDITAPAGSPVYASTGGVVVNGNGNDPDGMGYYVVIRTMWEGTPVFTVYGHLQAPSGLTTGGTIMAGSQIGLVGRTGNATENLLHYEERIGTPGQPDNWKRGALAVDPSQNYFGFTDPTQSPSPTVPAGILAQLKSLLDQLDALRKGYYDNGTQCIPISISNGFSAAARWIQPVFGGGDPLTLDLNGNGIETISANLASPILFDHEGDSIKSGTGWIAPSDGFLALDRNGNGAIDNGSELFGNSTPLVSGGNAADGFAALVQEDNNADGVVNAQDANFANLRVWQDLNQDGISQAGELSTLAQLNIASIKVAKTEHSSILPGGNEIADLGSFTRTDGTTSGMADVNLASDTFHRSFNDVIPTTPQTATLPDMQGSGVVRDLREAASLSSVLLATLEQYALSTTRTAQHQLLDTLVSEWGATSGMADMQTRATTNGYTITTNLDAVHYARLTALEQFNGRSFYRLPWREAANDVVFEMRRVG